MTVYIFSFLPQAYVNFFKNMEYFINFPMYIFKYTVIHLKTFSIWIHLYHVSVIFSVHMSKIPNPPHIVLTELDWWLKLAGSGWETPFCLVACVRDYGNMPCGLAHGVLATARRYISLLWPAWETRDWEAKLAPFLCVFRTFFMVL